MNAETVADYLQPIHIKSGYEKFFNQCMDLIKYEKEINHQLGEKIKSLALSFPQYYDLEDFNIDSHVPYERTYLGKDSSGWEMILMTWHKGRKSSIHGHPQFAGYNILKGSLQLEIFEEKENNKIALKTSINVDGGNGFFAIGNHGIMNNHIHRITCISDVAYSLHVYSDDARKGITYTL